MPEHSASGQRVDEFLSGFVQRISVSVPLIPGFLRVIPGIEHFGLALVTPAQFIAVASTVISVPLEPILLQVHHWSNKQLAHFTLSQPTVTLQSIRNMSVAMIEAYMQLLFAALGRPRPSINPSPS